MIYLQVNLDVAAKDRAAAAAIYEQYKQPFLKQVSGARSKELLVRREDVQVLHGFESAEQARAYLASALIINDIATALKPLLRRDPDIRIYAAA